MAPLVSGLEELGIDSKQADSFIGQTQITLD